MLSLLQPHPSATPLLENSLKSEVYAYPGNDSWMLNSVWPSVFWQLYDYYLQPTGAFYGAQKACETLHIQYSYDNATIWGLNMSMAPYHRLTARAVVKTLKNETLHEQSCEVSLNALERKCLFELPSLPTSSPVHFLFLTLAHEETVVSRNVYWLATKPDIFTQNTTQKFYWPLKQHADMSKLRNLPKAEIKWTSVFIREDDAYAIRVTLSNRSDSIAFFLWLELRDKTTGDLAAPVYWSENGLTLQAGESWNVTGRVPADMDVKQLEVTVEQ